jgi:hypothetical protein
MQDWFVRTRSIIIFFILLRKGHELSVRTHSMNINFLCDGHPPQGVSSGTAGLGDNCISFTDLPPRKPRQGQRRS